MPAGAVLGETLCAPSVQVAVRDQRPVERDAHLATVCVSRDDQVVPVVRHRVDDAPVRRMGDADRNINLFAVDRAGDFSVMIMPQMWIVGPAEAESHPFDLQRRAGVSQVDPPRLLETSPEILPREGLMRTTISAARTLEVTHRVLECRRVVVVGAPDVNARTLQQPPEAAKHERHRLMVSEVVAGVDHKVRLQRTKCGQPALAGSEVRRHMHVGDVQYPNGPRTGRQYWHIHPTQPERVDLIQPRVRQAAGADRPDAQQAFDDRIVARFAATSGKATSETCCNTGRMPDAPSTLKERLRSDLTAAIRDRDKVRTGTIRMVLTAITEAEVAGSEAVELSDQQVLDVVIKEAKKRREAEAAYADAGRSELAEKERAESDVLAGYLPEQLTQEQIAAIVADAIASTGTAELGVKGMGKVMAQVTPQTKGKADGSVVAAEVRRQLSG